MTWQDSTAARDFASLQRLFGMGPLVPEAQVERTDADRLRAWMDWSVWPQVLEHLDEDPEDANDLYGEALCEYAIGQDARVRAGDHSMWRRGAWHARPGVSPPVPIRASTPALRKVVDVHLHTWSPLA
ncbi:hypothetical protein [Streptomyces sp. NBC_00009]|uniref:hypothetical protein n=1 Tax=Streptomyces sp. NBC_00009 TaxID=2975620 RepID=UPI0032508A6C